MTSLIFAQIVIKEQHQSNMFAVYLLLFVFRR